MNQLDGLSVVVTGGAGALGSAVVELLLKRGATVHVPCFNDRELERFSHAKHPRVHTSSPVNIADETAAHALFASVPELYASIHLVGGFTMAPLVETSLADFRRMMDMNATSCFLSCREAIKRMHENGRESGRIVNVAARPVLLPSAGSVAYSASKAAVASITQCTAEEVRAMGIWVNAVVPSIMDTPVNRQAMPDADHSKWAKVEEVAETIVFLASPTNATTSGSLVTVYGRS